VDNGSASRCVPQAAEDSDYDDVLENWDDEDAGERNRGPTLDESGDEVFSCSLLALGCPLSQTATRHTTLGCCLVVAKATAATNIYCCGVVFFLTSSCGATEVASVCGWLPNIPYKHLPFLLTNMLRIYFNSKHIFFCIKQVSFYNLVNRLLASKP
jgi:hypothetical protein